MAEKNEKVELNYLANAEAAAAIPSDQRLVTNIGQGKSGNDRYEVYFLIPKTDEECQARYGQDLAFLVELGVRNISTKPKFETAFDEASGTFDHAMLQKLADEYRPGVRQPSVKAEQARLGAEVAALTPEGMTTAEFIEWARKNVGKAKK
jgi:hypothetical protein